ncbi:Oligopeptidase [Pseudoalteromonas issachenkonii]|jgi:oligopeptidase B|uniref:Oligopeptidase B n=1 Tax=Pseudoalteromonas issachenkonii TaxID=152297 RepID=A0ABM6MYX1_9GAMM|nr:MULTISPECIES: oligopeptidase B [Pseudoalteromonas]ADT67031.1 oligopeptidase [Pseudoalteromonas sp. SM9913]ALQ53406.1 Oligopeptidase [Pseudoalteromonas issachenkonii]ATC89149.1 oligopeptidase B [Pseudoalteromonas issachenkonii]MDN3396188.1 oligopeptidase B [Pseudoalteromonas sp. APC 3215]MDN3402809.1 oligopeptidase B [Pseudoalteromonas sp. APC 3213]|tara:strand:- start:52298 stop:54469 length:2172 start_codon:yes stop_codon:yes gene_type:complete
MKHTPFVLTFISLAILGGCNKAPDVEQSAKVENVAAQTEVMPPVAKKVPYEMTIHGDTRIDDYYWMRDDERKDPEVLSYLEAENAYTDAMLAHTKTLQTRLFEELKGRIQKDDDSVPVKNGDYYYSSQTRGDNEYATYVRSSDFAGTDQQVILDVNELAKEHDYYAVSGLDVSPNGNLMAYGEDTVSRRIYNIKIKDLSTGKLLEDTLKGTNGSVVWANDNKTLYYIKKDLQTLLGYQVYRHTLGTPQAEDELVYEETDTSYYMGISKSKDDSEIYIWHSSTTASGVSVLSADDVKAMPKRLIEREADLEYGISKLGNTYYIVTNLNAVNFQLMKVDIDKAGDKANWQTVIPARDNIKLEGIDLFNDYLVYQQREMGQSTIIARNLTTGKEIPLSFNDSAYTISTYGNNDLNSDTLRVYYTSMTTPASSYDVNLATGNKTLLKQQKVLGDFSADNYASERIFVTARDGIKVPVSLVYRKDMFKKEGTNPLLQYGYGSYGATMDPTFSSARLSLLDRGFVFAIAHIRGSQMLGRPWYEDGKLLTKKNTFNDFVDVTKALVEQKYGAKDKIFAQGGSAGGLLMGAVANQAPELYKGMVAAVPFVDVVTTMLDASIPLTTNEYGEWGNPNEKEYYEYMLSYSPYDQVSKQDYPNMLVTTGLHDSQVQYFEPAKWVAKLRDYKTDDNKLLFKIDMEAGHGGASGRFKRLEDTALNYAFMLDLAGVNK